MDRAPFTCSFKSFPFSSPRSPTHFTFSSAVHVWPKSNGCLLKEKASLSAAASVLGFFHSLKVIEAVTPTLLCKSERKDYACRFSAEHGSSLSEAAASNQSKEGLQLPAIEETGHTWLDRGAAGNNTVLPEENGNSFECLERGFVGNPSPSDSNGGARPEQVKLAENSTSSVTSSIEGASIPVKEPIYEVVEVKPGGSVITKSVSRRLLLKTSGLRLRDIRSVDPSLWVTNAAPALLIRDEAILLNLGSLRAIASADNVLIFDYKSVGAVAFLDLLLQRLNPDSNPGLPAMPFELEVVEAALLSRTQRLERRLMEIEPRVLSLLEALPNCLTANILEELRLSKQALVELGSKSGALRQMLLELLESPQEIRRMTIMGRGCTISKEDGSVECMASFDKQLADDEEEEMEMLLENYLQRCESCHGQAERLLDSAKEMEDSIAVNLSSRRLEVSRLELLLQVGTFCSALGALVAGVFGMNLRSYLEGSAVAFWLTTAGIVLGGIILFFIMYNHLKKRKIL
eukprot:c19724_g3_i1 orf=228-1778(-)